MDADTHPDRRNFLKTLGLAGAGIFVAAQTASAATVPRRKFGRHDITVSTLGLGGHALRLASDDDAQRMVDEALDLGVDFFDNSWDYHDGRSEELMGRCIAGKRDRVFLMTKVCTHGKGRDVAMRMLDESLRRLGTDHLDLWQVHAVATQEQVKSAYAKGGVLEALDEARRQGKVRFVGFTGHTDPDVHLAMLAGGYPFDACQLPISAIEANANAFVRRVLPELVRRGIAPIAMKSLGGNAAPFRDGVVTLREALAYALSQPVATLVSGVINPAQLRENAAIAAADPTLSTAEMAALEKRCQPATESKRYEPYRKWMSYRDGDAAAGLV
jgi:aryl-alcohol dehydrogenase-like predicted oxidoreductase